MADSSEPFRPQATAPNHGKDQQPSAEMPRPSTSPDELESVAPPAAAFKPTFRLYAIVVGLGIANLLAALENTVITIAAPVILTDLEFGDNFIWITNAFFLSRYVCLVTDPILVPYSVTETSC